MFIRFFVFAIFFSSLIADEPFARVTNFSGNIFYRTQGELKKNRLTQDTTFSTNTRIKLETNSSLTIKFSHDDSQKVFKGPFYFKLTNPTDQTSHSHSTKLNLYTGRSNAKVSPLDLNAKFTIRTPSISVGSGNITRDFISGYQSYVNNFYGPTMDSSQWVGLSIVTSKGRLMGMKHARKALELSREHQDKSLFKKAKRLGGTKGLSESNYYQSLQNLFLNSIQK
jgi:hypothetical protein